MCIPFLVLGILFLVVGAGFVWLADKCRRGKLKPNPFAGIRIPKAFESEENWYKIHKYYGDKSMIADIIICAIGLLCILISFHQWSDSQSNVIGLSAICVFMLALNVPVIQVLFYARKI